MIDEKKIYYLGPKTSYTDVAKDELKTKFNLQNYIDIEKRTITAVASELSHLENDCSLAVLPIENSIEGIVKESIDNISRIEDDKVKILAECVIPIQHCLISYADKIDDIKIIISHPQAISQCFDYIYKTFGNNIEYKSESSTANAVKNLLPDNKNVAVIGSMYSAKYYDKPVIVEGINDDKYNQTRFLLIGKMNLSLSNCEYKTSINFSTENKSGALCEILKILQKYEINMSYISSRPSKKVFGEYSFYIDFDGDINELKVKSAISEIIKHTKTFKHLGSYPKFL